MKNIFIKLLLLFISSIFFLNSCEPKKIDEPIPEKPKPEPEPEKPVANKKFHYHYDSETKNEFIEFTKGIKTKDLSEQDIPLFFGNRFNYMKPDSLYINEDSLFIYKNKMPTESFKIKWDEQSLLTFDSKNNQWKKWAIRNSTDSSLSLNINFYKRTIQNNSRSNLSIGQHYDGITYNDFLDSENQNNSKLIWLSKNYRFNLLKK